MPCCFYKYSHSRAIELNKIFPLSSNLNLHPGDLAEDLSESEGLPSTARHASRRAQTAGPTRAIARTQQSERVRANVNRHRITQARSSQVWHEA